MQLIAVAILVAQARDLLAIAQHFGGQGAGDDLNVRQAVQLALQHGIGTQLAVELDQRHLCDDTGQVNGRFHAGIASADHSHTLALNSGPSQCGQ